MMSDSLQPSRLLLAIAGFLALVAATTGSGIILQGVMHSDYTYQVRFIFLSGTDLESTDTIRQRLVQVGSDAEIESIHLDERDSSSRSCEASSNEFTMTVRQSFIQHLRFFRNLDVRLNEQGLHPCVYGYRQSSRASMGPLALLWGAAPVSLFICMMLLRSANYPERRRLWMPWEPRLERRPAFACGIFTALCMILVSVGIQSMAGSPSNQWSMLSGSDLWILFPAMLIFAPIMEEYAFRAWLLERLRPLIGPIAALGISTVLFTLMHFPDSVSGAVTIGMLGILLGSAWLWTRSLVTCVIAHAGYNLFAFWSLLQVTG